MQPCLACCRRAARTSLTGGTSATASASSSPRSGERGTLPAYHPYPRPRFHRGVVSLSATGQTVGRRTDRPSCLWRCCIASRPEGGRQLRRQGWLNNPQRRAIPWLCWHLEVRQRYGRRTKVTKLSLPGGACSRYPPHTARRSTLLCALSQGCALLMKAEYR